MQILQKGGEVEVVIALISVAANAAQTRHEVAGDTCGKVRGAVRIMAGYDTKQVGAKAGGGVRERLGGGTPSERVGAARVQPDGGCLCYDSHISTVLVCACACACGFDLCVWMCL